MDNLDTSTGFKLNKKTLTTFGSVLLVVLALAVGVYLVQQKQLFKPKAGGPGISAPETSFSLFTANNPSNNYAFRTGEEVRVSVFVRTDLAAANLFAAKIQYPANLLELKRIIAGDTIGVGSTASSTTTTSKATTIQGGGGAGGGTAPYCVKLEMDGRGSGKIISGTTTTVNPGQNVKIVASIGQDNGDHSSIVWNVSGGQTTGGWDTTTWTVPINPQTNLYYVTPYIYGVPQSNCTATFAVNMPTPVPGSFIKNWVERSSAVNGNVGTISVVGGVPNPGYRTYYGQESGVMAELVFKVKQADYTTELTIATGSAIYRNSDNANILDIKRNLKILTSDGVTPTISTPTPTPGQPLNRTDVNMLPAVRGQYASASGTITVDLMSYDAQRNTGNFILHGTVKGLPWNYSRYDVGVCRQDNSCSYDQAPVNLDSNGNIVFSNQYINSSNNQPNNPISYILITNTNYCPFSSPCLRGDYSVPGTYTSAPSGDVNMDGKIDLSDMSALFTRWGSSGSNVGGADLNKDGVVNSIDYSLLIQILIDKGVISSASQLPPAL